jgi:hypothetical protein
MPILLRAGEIDLSHLLSNKSLDSSVSLERVGKPSFTARIERPLYIYLISPSSPVFPLGNGAHSDSHVIHVRPSNESLPRERVPRTQDQRDYPFHPFIVGGGCLFHHTTLA